MPADDFTLAQAANLTDFTSWAYGNFQDSSLSNGIGWLIFNVNEGLQPSLFDNSAPPSGSPEPGTLIGLLALGVFGAFAGARRG